MLLTYNTSESIKVYEVDEIIRTKVFADMCDGYEYIKRAIDPNVENVHWFRLENNILQVLFRRRLQ